VTEFALLLDALMVVGLVSAFALAGRLLGPKPAHTPDGELPYETGQKPIQQAATSMTVLYWRIAVLFVVFDVDLAFLLPWAFNRPELTRTALASVTVFTLLVGFMLAYFWRKGALELEQP
jgi:NADH:ubiquinone oxidoreductase subunit 3 (subunit A)